MGLELNQKYLKDLHSNLGNIGKMNLNIKDDIIAAAKAYVEADVQITPGEMSYKVSKQEGAFARVAISVQQEGGYALILKKVNELWVVVAAGQDLPGKDAGKKYGMPDGWFSTDY